MILYEYDSRDRITQMTDQLDRYESYTYYTGAEITPTTGDNLKSFTDRKGQTTVFGQYDPMNRLKSVSFSDGTTLQYVYDAAGRAKSITDSLAGAKSNSKRWQALKKKGPTFKVRPYSVHLMGCKKTRSLKAYCSRTYQIERPTGSSE